MTHARVVARELRQSGFHTELCSQGVIVSLNRNLSTSEVELALQNIFDEIAFKVSKINANEVLVQE